MRPQATVPQSNSFGAANLVGEYFHLKRKISFSFSCCCFFLNGSISIYFVPQSTSQIPLAPSRKSSFLVLQKHRKLPIQLPFQLFFSQEQEWAAPVDSITLNPPLRMSPLLHTQSEGLGLRQHSLPEYHHLCELKLFIEVHQWLDQTKHPDLATAEV